MISQLILNNLHPNEHHPILVLVGPGMSKTALMKEILTELNIPLPEDHFTSTQDLLKLLSDHVIALYRQGRKLVILIDECHFLSSDSLHMVRTITNIEVPDRKLVTCILFGEQRFLKRLNHPSHASLRNRMYLRGELGPISEAECAEFVKFRLLKAGRMDDLFDRGALAALHECSGGICRNINKLGMLSLLEGFMKRRPIINDEIVRTCASRA
jgi:general secretion pathway protein A